MVEQDGMLRNNLNAHVCILSVHVRWFVD